MHDGGGCRDIAVSVQVLPVEAEASVAGELLEESSLGPAVALVVRVDGIDLARRLAAARRGTVAHRSGFLERGLERLGRRRGPR